MTWPFEKLEIAPEIQADESMNRRVSAATRLLQSVVGKSARRLRVSWLPFGQQQLRLILTDSTGQVFGDFAIDELAADFALRRRLSKLRNDLLDNRLEILMDRVMHPEDEVAVS